MLQGCQARRRITVNPSCFPECYHAFRIGQYGIATGFQFENFVEDSDVATAACLINHEPSHVAVFKWLKPSLHVPNLMP